MFTLHISSFPDWLESVKFGLTVFIHCDSETTKNVLIASTYIHLKCNKFAKYTSDLPTVIPRILLSGPAGKVSYSCWCILLHFKCMADSDIGHFSLPGSEIYQEILTKALAKHFGARLLMVDSLLLPGVSFFYIFVLVIFRWNYRIFFMKLLCHSNTILMFSGVYSQGY